jgi:phage-related minor tail protein
MAETVRGINVVISGDTTRLGKALEDVNKKSKDIQNELRQVDRLLKLDPTNTTLLAQKQQLLSQAIESTSEKLNRLKLAQQQVAEQFARGEISEGQYRAFQREIAKTEQELQRFQERLQETNEIIEKQPSAWSRLQERLDGVAQRLQEVGNRIRGVAKSLGTIAPTVGPSLAVLTGGVMALGSSFAAAGIGAVAFGAVATSSLNSVFDAAEEVQKLEEKIANADSAKERIKAQQELVKLYESMTEAQRNALKELQGFKSFWSDFTKQFETPVFEAFANVLKGTKTLLQGLEPTIKNVADVVVELTNEFNQALQSSSVKGFFEWLETNAAESIYNFAHIFGNVFMGVMNLLQAFSPLGASIEEGLVRLTERFREWTASLSQSAGFQQFVEYVKENGPILLNIIGNVAKTIGALIVALAPIGSVIGSALLHIVNTVTSFIAKLAEALSSSETFKNGVSTVFNTIRTVVLQAIGAVRDFVVQKVGEIRTFWEQNGEQIRAAAEKVFSFIQTIVSTTMPIVLGVIKSVWENIKGAISGAIKVILGVIKTFSALLTGDWKGVWEGIKKILSGAVQFIWNAIQLGFMGKILGVIRGFVSNAIGKAGELASKFKGKFGEILSTAKSKFDAAKNAILKPIESAKDKVLGIIDKIKSAFSRLSIKIPRPKLPDINVSWKSFGIGDLSVKIPKFSINWHAIGGVFKKPIVFGNAGFGDVEEAIVPFEGQHARKIAGLIAKEMPQQPAINITLNYQGSGSEQDAYRMIDIIERELGSRMSARLRMNGVK